MENEWANRGSKRKEMDDVSQRITQDVQDGKSNLKVYDQMQEDEERDQVGSGDESTSHPSQVFVVRCMLCLSLRFFSRDINSLRYLNNSVFTLNFEDSNMMKFIFLFIRM